MAHIQRYGRNNERRLTGRHETANVSRIQFERMSFIDVHVSNLDQHMHYGDC